MNRRSSALLTGLLLAPATAQIQWSALPQSQPPSRRFSAGMMTYDALRHRGVLFGGDSGTGPHLAGTFLLEVTTGAWSALPVGPAPTARAYHSMTYHAATDRVILFGGRLGSSNGTPSSETWSFDGTSWTQLLPLNTPSARFGHSAVYDSVRQRIVLFAGRTAVAHTADVWEWNGSNWLQAATTAAFPNNNVRRQAAIAHDPVAQRTVIFGGRTDATNSFFDGTFVWDGQAWTDITGPVRPSGRTGSMAYDPELDRIVLFGGATQNGIANDTWFLIGNTWVQQFPGGPITSRSGSPMFHDPVGKRLVLFGGAGPSVALNDLWQLRAAQPASITPFGTGCLGSAGIPSLGAGDHRLPWLDDSFSLRANQLGTAAGGGPSLALLVFGFSDQIWSGIPLPLDLSLIGLSGCTMRVAFDVPEVSSHTGSLTKTLSLPNNPALAGLAFFAQVLAIDPAAPNQFGGALSNAVRMQIGQR
ncbi:MAG: hypothetical protein MUC36_27175 [Planctomycetes bacterium]|jgi:hypothetical protein|nr:hypothetical protein [Planctomycetota bacterium]